MNYMARRSADGRGHHHKETIYVPTDALGDHPGRDAPAGAGLTMALNLRVLSITVAVALAMLGAVLLADPESLGISPVAARWLGILAVGLGSLQGFLPRVQGPTKDPETLAERVWDLPPIERKMVAARLAERAEQVARITADARSMTRG